MTDDDMPSQGGSYIRQPAGGLKRTAFTAPEGEAAAAPNTSDGDESRPAAAPSAKRRKE